MKVRKNHNAIRFILLTFFLFAGTLFGAHPFYVSISELNYNNETKSLEISLRIFTNDLERTMQDWSAEKLYLGEENESPKADSLLKNYVLQELTIAVKGKTVPIHFIGKEVEQELTWIYFETLNTPSFDQIKISNRILFQSFPAQTNLVHVNNKGEIKSLLLTKNNPAGELNWD